MTLHHRRPFNLALCTHRTATDRTPSPVRFDPTRQISVLPDGTPHAHTTYATTMTSGMPKIPNETETTAALW